MSRRRRGPVARDQDTTPFGAILLRLCDGTGALGAALVDQEGETVDYAGYVDSYEIRVAAAEWRLVLRTLSFSNIRAWAATRQLFVRCHQRSFAAIALPEGYAIVLQLSARCFGLSERALAEATRELCAEAGLELPREGRAEHWSRVEVRPLPNDPRRPAAVWVGSTWTRVEVLGRYDSKQLARGELGYRARLASGAEINLVREKLGRWYAEDLPEH
ncbi:MAG: hypothetical protein U0263_24665 [Polyangiaceae bacterium]